jgi:hypothetical protein
VSERYQFDAEDRALLRSAAAFLKKVSEAKTTTPAEMASIAKVQQVLSLLPRVPSDFEVTVSVSSPRRRFDEIETWHWWEVAVEGERLSISSGGHFYRPSTGGDTFTTMTWAAVPDAPSELEDHSASLWMVPDVQAFPDGVASIDLNIEGYKVEVTDEDNPLLDDGLDGDEEAPGNHPAGGDLQNGPAKTSGRACFERIVHGPVFTRKDVLDFCSVPAATLDCWIRKNLIHFRKQPSAGSAQDGGWGLYELLQAKIFDVFCDGKNIRPESLNYAASAAADLVVTDALGFGVFADAREGVYRPDFGQNRFVISGPCHPLVTGEDTTLWEIRRQLVSTTWTAIDMNLFARGGTMPGIAMFLDRVKTMADFHCIEPDRFHRELFEGFNTGTYYAFCRLGEAVGHPLGS